MIKPTTGRVVHYYVSSIEAANGMEVYDIKVPLTALIAYVWSDTCVNLEVLDHAGKAWQRTSVPINISVAGATAWAEWMPFQMGQAAKTEAAEAKLNGLSIDPAAETLKA